MANIDPMVEVFIYENNQLLEQLEDMLLSAEAEAVLNEEQINEVFRIMHTIKGASAMMEFDTLAKVSHAIEDLFSYIREGNSPADSDWEKIFDLVLTATDFIKDEIAKIENGKDPDGHAEDLIDGLHELLASIKGEAPAAPPAEAAATPAPATAIDGEAAADIPGNYYRGCIVFEPGCQMEHVRAFGVVNDISDMCLAVAHIPEDIFGADSSEHIVENGFLIYLKSELPGEELQSKLMETLFLQSLDFEQLDPDNPEIPASIRGAGPAEELPAADEAPEVVDTQAAQPEQPKAEQPKPAEPAQAPAKAEQAKPAEAEDKKLADKKKAMAEAAATINNPESGGSKQSFISVNVSKLDKLLNLVGEIVTTESMVTRNPDLHGLQLDNFEKQAQQLRKLTDELQDVVMSIRMIPVSSTFHKMKRIVRDMSKKVSKAAQLVIIGEETEVDKNIIDNLGDPLMHIIRNSMDHGLETREERSHTKKPAQGTITLEARSTGGDVMIIITDDGRGLNREKILEKAADRGLLNKPESEITDKEVANFILMPGFSTNDEVTEFSGRGVGMDVVRKNIEKIGGTMSIDSIEGQGMSTTIKIPLTLAILDGMLISVGKTVFIVPVLTIRESFKPRMKDVIVDPDGAEMIMIRGQCYPIMRLHQHFGLEPKTDNFEDGILVMVEADHGVTCLFCDELIGETQAVIKPIPGFITANMSSSRGLGGCTIMGDGSISLILDINSLIDYPHS